MSGRWEAADASPRSMDTSVGVGTRVDARRGGADARDADDAAHGWARARTRSRLAGAGGGCREAQSAGEPAWRGGGRAEGLPAALRDLSWRRWPRHQKSPGPDAGGRAGADGRGAVLEDQRRQFASGDARVQLSSRTAAVAA